VASQTHPRGRCRATSVSATEDFPNGRFLSKLLHCGSKASKLGDMYLKKQGGESELKKPRVGVHCRVNDGNLKIHSKSLRETVSIRVLASSGVRLYHIGKILALLCAAQRAARLTMMKVAFMASIALRR
jgi:hypothetical protein